MTFNAKLYYTFYKHRIEQIGLPSPVTEKILEDFPMSTQYFTTLSSKYEWKVGERTKTISVAPSFDTLCNFAVFPVGINISKYAVRMYINGKDTKTKWVPIVNKNWRWRYKKIRCDFDAEFMTGKTIRGGYFCTSFTEYDRIVCNENTVVEIVVKRRGKVLGRGEMIVCHA